MAVTVRFAHPSTPEQRSWLAQTSLRLRGVHFSPLDDKALTLLQTVRRTRNKFSCCRVNDLTVVMQGTI